MPILVVDDDPQMLLYLRDALATEGYSPVVTSNHRELSRILQTEKPHLVLLDLVLPETDGIELMKTVPELSDVPVIFISSYGRDETIARALESGAADYIVKPFSPTELIARIKAALRSRNEPEPFLLGDLAIYYDQHKVTLAGHPVQLTVTEYEVLCMLSVNAGKVTSFDSLLHKVWHKKPSSDPRLVRTIVKNLRRKLGDDSNQPAYIFSETRDRLSHGGHGPLLGTLFFAPDGIRCRTVGQEDSRACQPGPLPGIQRPRFSSPFGDCRTVAWKIARRIGRMNLRAQGCKRKISRRRGILQRGFAAWTPSHP